ncbi:myrosinase 1-like isoform X2 [Colletes gigas]|uniref:myrosinase 1-like isoform X2 n=1 Tax=Colletes gigas TaxID=935657 RepID=UPI001C9A37E2|nr:myrosinase 1-like isoform X2 [Colletes gigas]
MFVTLSFTSSILLFLVITANGNSVEKDDKYLTFPANFLLGASTAAYQIEGAWNVSDKGESVWDRFSHYNDGRIINDETGDVAADSYHKYKEDVNILKRLGFTSYRFSVSWPRILPTGFANNVSQDGVNYYHNLIDELLANGIEPLLTLCHWDHPQVLEDANGWLNPEMVDWFGDFARVVYREYGAKVKRFITINEIGALCKNGYSYGFHAPGKKLHGFGEYLCVHNALKAHARAYRIYEREFKPTYKGQVGFMINSHAYMPKIPEDAVSAEIAFLFNCGWTLHPIYSEKGDYPEIMKNMVAAKSKQQGYAKSRLPEFEPEWIEYIRGTSDFMAVNHYTSKLVEPGERGKVPSHDNDQGVKLSVDDSWKSSASAWLKVVPRGFRYVLRQLSSKYGNPPMYITENGFSDLGTLNDTDRVDYYREYLKQMLLAIHVDGVNVRGYYLWSLLDNFEWERGYSEHFGIVYVDINDPNRKRTLKESATWWQQVATNKSVIHKFTQRSASTALIGRRMARSVAWNENQRGLKAVWRYSRILVP